MSADMFVRSRGVWFGFAENMFTFCSAKSRKHVFSGDDSWRLSSFFKLIFIYEHWLVITASWEDLAAVVFVSNKFMSSCVQYAVLSPRLKVINLNILPESSRDELKYSLNIAFMFLSIILRFQVPDINILLRIRKKATVFDGPWSASQASSTKKNLKML